MVAKRSRNRGFTLIEVLVVVAIIALLTAILIPSLSNARDQAKRVLCTSNMHQGLLAQAAYSYDHKTYLPWRGWFSYDISESYQEAGLQKPASVAINKVLVNLAMLIGGKDGKLANKYLKGWDCLYCPSSIATYKEGGLKMLWDPAYTHTYGGFNYAVPMGQRKGAPRMDFDVYPRYADKLDGRWLEVLRVKYNEKFGTSIAAGAVTDKVIQAMMPRRIQPLVMDFIAGGGQTFHKGGYNVAYSDGHARFVKVKGPVGESVAVSNTRAFELWYDMTVQP